MEKITTINELEEALRLEAVKGVQVSFGASASPLRQGQWFANIGSDENRRQVRGPTLAGALNALLGRGEVVDVMTEPVKVKPAPPKTPTSLIDLLS
jgi:hypothetical protein